MFYNLNVYFMHQHLWFLNKFEYFISLKIVFVYILIDNRIIDHLVCLILPITN